MVKHIVMWKLKDEIQAMDKEHILEKHEDTFREP